MDCSIVLFIPPKKLIKNLEIVINFFKKREIVLCREMTKIHEEFIRCKVEDLKKIKIYDKGELTIVISEIKESTNSFDFLTESDKKIIKMMLKNKSIKDIIKKFSNKKIPKKIITRLTMIEKKYFLSVKTKVLDGRIFITGKVDDPEEKLKITKIAWETSGVRSVRNDIKIKEKFNFKQSAKDTLITSQLRAALIINKNIKSSNYQIDTYKKNIYIYGIARNRDELDLVIYEANSILDVELLNGAISIACPNPIKRGPINFALLIDCIILYDIAALC